VSNELRKNEPDRDIEVRIPPGIKAWGDEGLLRIALENLFANAWKFTAATSHPQIELGQSERNGSRFFFVRDNGAGFDSANAHRLFGVFQRLHSTKEFPGTGIGLATVKRIISRHGGDIWAESKVGSGATFCFTLPQPTLPQPGLPLDRLN
jgi:light-regulated signal transduction histidine kinase (bacteriophytochrome)